LFRLIRVGVSDISS